VGGGTSLAIIGAYVLASELAKAGGDLGRGFAAYQQVLDPVVRQSRLIGPATIDLVIPNSRRQIWLIAQALRFLPRLPDRLRRRLTAAGGSPAAMLSEAALTRPDDVPLT
jgi:2-polyprenyl-6-methoxyphenol hydroxylase-like FAD-dependent oxidoreductase